MLLIPKPNIHNEITIQISVCNQAFLRTPEITLQTSQKIIQRTNHGDGQKVKHSINQQNNRAQTLASCHVRQVFAVDSCSLCSHNKRK